MLDQKDLCAIAEIVDQRVAKTETLLRGEMQEMKVELRGEMQEMKAELRGEMQEMKVELRGEMQEMKEELQGKIIDTRDLLLDEISRLNGQLSGRMDKLEKNMDDMNEYYRIRKLEDRNDGMFFRLLDEVRADVDELKMRFA